MAARAAIEVVVLSVLSACAPEYDWRELKSAEGAFSALMPAKPAFEERPLAHSSDIIMRLWSAQVADSVFGIGYADYPTAGAQLLDATRDALVANMRGHVVEERPVAQYGLDGREFTAESGDVELKARLFVSGRRLYQVAVLGRKSSLSAPGADVDLFLSSFRPLAAGT